MAAPNTPVSEIMRSEFVSLSTQDKLDFVDEVMKLGRIRHFPVMEGEKLVGIVSHRDLLAASLTKVLDFDGPHRRSFLHSIEVAEVMSPEVQSVQPDTPLSEVARIMVQRKFGCLPVVNDAGTPVGIVTESDLLQAAYLKGE